MIGTTVFTLMLIGASFTNAVDISLNQAFNTEYAAASQLIHGVLTVAGNLDKIKQQNWDDVVVGLVPNLQHVQKGLESVVTTVTKLLLSFEKETGNGSGEMISIPENILDLIYQSLTGIANAIDNIEHSKLIVSIGNNTETLQTINGNVIVPTTLANQFTRIFFYISQQLSDIRSYAIEFQTALTDLSNEIAANKGSSFGPYLFKVGSVTVQKMANQVGNMLGDVEAMGELFAEAAIPESNGVMLLPAAKITAATTQTTQNIAHCLDQVAEEAQLYIGHITSDSYNY